MWQSLPVSGGGAHPLLKGTWDVPLDMVYILRPRLSHGSPEPFTYCQKVLLWHQHCLSINQSLFIGMVLTFVLGKSIFLDARSIRQVMGQVMGDLLTHPYRFPGVSSAPDLCICQSRNPTRRYRSMFMLVYGHQLLTLHFHVTTQISRNK